MARRATRRHAATLQVPARVQVAAAGARATDGFVPLSQCGLWALQREYFMRTGIDAWRTNTVPSFATSNPYIAHAYAQIALAYMDDCGLLAPTLKDAKERLHIVELGAGSGRFAFHFLRSITSLLDDEGVPRNRLRYVMTDIVPANIAFWRGHEQLRPFIDAGILDFAEYDAVAGGAVQLQVSGDGFDAERPMPRVVGIANYVFDSIEQDLFEIDRGTLKETAVRLVEERGHDHDADGAALATRSRPCEDDYYGVRAWDAILAEYRRLARASIVFPVGALRCLGNLRALANDRLLVLSVDWGWTRLSAAEGAAPPCVLRHGSISMDVNFHALAAYTRIEQGRVLENPRSRGKLLLAGFVFDADHANLSRTFRAHAREVAQFTPADFAALKRANDRPHDTRDVSELLAMVRLGRGSEEVLRAAYEPLVHALAGASPAEREDVLAVLDDVWNESYAMRPEARPAFELGTLAAAAQGYERSIAWFDRARAQHGPAPAIAFNVGLSLWNLGRLVDGRASMADALALDPGFAPARRFLADKGMAPLGDVGSVPTVERRARPRINWALVRDRCRDGNVRLEPLSAASHARAIYEVSNPRVLRLTQLPALRSPAAAHRWIEAERHKSNMHLFAVRHHRFGIIGVASIRVLRGSGHIYYWVGQAFWGQGFGAIAISQLLRIGVAALGVTRFRTCVLRENRRSAHLLESFGFRRQRRDKSGLEVYCAGGTPGDVAQPRAPRGA